MRARSFQSLSLALSRRREIQPQACVVRHDDVEAAPLALAITQLRREMPFTDVVAWTPSGLPSLVRAGLKAGACEVVWSDDASSVVDAVAKVVGEQRVLPRIMAVDARESGSWCFEELVSRSRKMWDIFDLCSRAASTDAPVLLLGETGTGKELLARAFHKRSGRKGRFVALNGASVPDGLIDSELFGHVQGAFTGADHQKMGLFRAADGGTLLLDEVGDLSPSVQQRLLRALQEGKVRPVGGEDEISVDVRVIAATSRTLDAVVASGGFRPDLLYRLDVIRVIVPPLRERRDDILFLFGYFARTLSEQYGIERPDVSDGFLDALTEHDWPGNVRELQNFTERMLLTQSGRLRSRAHFRRLMLRYEGQGEGLADGGAAPGRRLGGTRRSTCSASWPRWSRQRWRPPSGPTWRPPCGRAGVGSA